MRRSNMNRTGHSANKTSIGSPTLKFPQRGDFFPPHGAVASIGVYGFAVVTGEPGIRKVLLIQNLGLELPHACLGITVKFREEFFRPSRVRPGQCKKPSLEAFFRVHCHADSRGYPKNQALALCPEFPAPAKGSARRERANERIQDASRGR